MAVQTTKEFNKSFHAVAEDVQMLNYYWLTFTGMFSNDDDRTELYTNTAPNALRFLREALLDAIMLRSARLCDPPKTLGHHNLNLRSIAEEPEVAKVAPLKAELNKCLARIDPHYEPVKLWRVKRLVHTDLKTRLGTEELPDLPYQHLKELIQHITDFANLIYKHLLVANRGFSNPGYCGGPDRLIYFLRKGYEAHLIEMRQNEVR